MNGGLNSTTLGPPQPAMNHRTLFALAIAAPLPAIAVDFKKDIQPIFKKHCYECHSEQADKKKAGYVFDDLHTLVLDIGPNGIIVPGEVSESHLYEVLTNGEGEKDHMPPENKPQLSSGDIKKIETWIKEGAFLVSPTLKASGAGIARMKWRNKEGKEIEASFVKLEGPNVHLRMPAGQVLPYPVEKLTADSQIQIRKVLLELAGEKPLVAR